MKRRDRARSRDRQNQSRLFPVNRNAKLRRTRMNAQKTGREGLKSLKYCRDSLNAPVLLIRHMIKTDLTSREMKTRKKPISVTNIRIRAFSFF
jgi:hypothetical protein